MNISLLRPVHGGYVSQWFGEHPEWYNKFNIAGHNGIDYAVAMNAPVFAAHDGHIITFPIAPNGYGIYCKVVNDTLETIYAHLATVTTANGNLIKAGEVLGYSGNTGNSTGPHLHFGLRIHGMRNQAYNNYIDPAPFRDI